MKNQVTIKDMMGKSAQVNGNGSVMTQPSDQPSKPKQGKKALEDIYTKKTQLEHILLRPDTYIGSVEFNTETMFVYDKEAESIIEKEVTFVPGLYKIFDEILVNAADHKQRDPKMDTIKIEIQQEENTISIWNNGKGIPVSIHKGEQMYVPTMIFGHLLTSSNFDDEEQKVTGGRNGYGAKLCNIFSTKFVVETACQQDKKSFKQAWANNMSKVSEPKIKDFGSSEFTKITFSPDLSKFKMDKLDDDIVAIMSRRAYDVAASTRGVKVFLNGKRVQVKNFKEYVDLFLKNKEDNSGKQIKCVYESVNDRWEVAVALSDKERFQQMSFVNSIATTKGGKHVDYITDMIVKNLVECLKKKNKTGMNIKPAQIKNHLWVFINALIVNPTFDSQTKENMTLQPKSFGSKCALSDKFITAASKCGVVESIMAWARYKQQTQLQSKCAGKKQTKLKGIPKLEDANDAGSRYSSECTLILTEGDSAKSLAVAGLGVIGRDRYGVFPLKGKMLNVREATHNQILENPEINNVLKILGLSYKKKYDSETDFKTLRYGKLMIMTDQDQDGSHIKGLVINFIHHNWPTLLKQNFIEEFITPIVKAVKGKEEFSFYSIPEFDEWKKSKDNWHTYKIKYYKGLGTSTSKEAKEYFQDMRRHRIFFKYGGSQDDHAITMAFSRKAIDQRKEWLTSWMEECKRRKELGLPEIYLYEKDTRSVNYTDFVNKELVLFSNLDNERSIPCLVDGLKPGQRKVLFTCLKRNDKREIKVAQLAGSVAEHSAYHHGEASLMSTIINLAQNYVGSNNINLLKPIGQFGTRLQGGKDAASPRYIFTQLSPLTRILFNVNDEPLLNFLNEDNQKIEPEWYIPIIPMVLVNGAEGIGTGWSTKIPNYNPREIAANLKRMIRGEEPVQMIPWFKNFRGVIEELDNQRYMVSGEIAKLAYNKYEITELPIRTWTQTYKENVMETLLQGTEKNPALLSEYLEYNTDTTVKFIVTVPESKADKVDEEGPHKIFKLQSIFSTSSMVLFDKNGCLKKYESPNEILLEFFDLRLKYYEKRKNFMVGMLEAESSKLSNQARFIIEKCDGRLTVENKKKKEMISELQRKGFQSDPVKAWKAANSTAVDEDESGNEEEEDEYKSLNSLDYDYLLGMTMWTLTKEKKDELLKKRDDKVHEMEELKKKSPSNLWEDDLDYFLKELDDVEAAEREEDAPQNKKIAAAKPKKRNNLVAEVLPSPTAERIVPRIDEETKRKMERAAANKDKVKKPRKTAAVELDEFDNLVSENTGKSLVARLGNSPDMIEKKFKEEKKSRKEAKLKQSTLNFKPKPKGKGKLTLDTDDEEDDIDDDDIMDIDVAPRERTTSRRNAASKVKYNFSDEESRDSDMSFHSNEGVEEQNHVAQNLTFEDSIVKSKDNEMKVSDSDSEFEAKTSQKNLPPKKHEQSASDMFDDLLSKSPLKRDSGSSKSSHSDSDDSATVPLVERLDKVAAAPKEVVAKPKSTKQPLSKSAKPQAPSKKAAPKKTAAPKRKAFSSDDEDDDDFFNSKPKKGKASQKKKDDDDFHFDDSTEIIAPRQVSARSKPAAKYKFSDSESDDDF